MWRDIGGNRILLEKQYAKCQQCRVYSSEHAIYVVYMFLMILISLPLAMEKSGLQPAITLRNYSLLQRYPTSLLPMLA